MSLYVVSFRNAVTYHTDLSDAMKYCISKIILSEYTVAKRSNPSPPLNYFAQGKIADLRNDTDLGKYFVYDLINKIYTYYSNDNIYNITIKVVNTINNDINEDLYNYLLLDLDCCFYIIHSDIKNKSIVFYNNHKYTHKFDDEHVLTYLTLAKQEFNRLKKCNNDKDFMDISEYFKNVLNNDIIRIISGFLVQIHDHMFNDNSKSDNESDSDNNSESDEE